MSSKSPDVYMSGALSAPPEEEVEFLEEEIYNRVYDISEEIGLYCYCPHKSSTDPSKPMVHGKIWEIDYQKVMNSGVVVAYIGVPSLGVGAETVMARTEDVPVILIAEESEHENISRLMTGNPTVKDIILFEEPEEIEDDLKRHFFEIFSRQNLDTAAEEENWDVRTYNEMEEKLNKQFDLTEGKVFHRDNPVPISKEKWKEWADSSSEGEQDTLF